MKSLLRSIELVRGWEMKQDGRMLVFSNKQLGISMLLQMEDRKPIEMYNSVLIGRYGQACKQSFSNDEMLQLSYAIDQWLMDTGWSCPELEALECRNNKRRLK